VAAGRRVITVVTIFLRRYPRGLSAKTVAVSVVGNVFVVNVSRIDTQLVQPESESISESGMHAEADLVEYALLLGFFLVDTAESGPFSGAP
jgi:hypothetical protein